MNRKNTDIRGALGISKKKNAQDKNDPSVY